jgi:hypothetical protein
VPEVRTFTVDEVTGEFTQVDQVDGGWGVNDYVHDAWCDDYYLYVATQGSPRGLSVYSISETGELTLTDE